MYSWWRRSDGMRHDGHRSGDRAIISRERRAVEARQHVEVIGGSYKVRRSSLQISMEKIIGPPRLPSEVFSLVISMAAQSLMEDVHGRGRTQQLLRLASVNKAAFYNVHTTAIMPDLRLQGVKQIVSLAQMLHSNTLNLRYLCGRIRRLTIRRSAPSRTNGRGSLYDDIEDMAKFERATLSSLRFILSYCTNLRYLSLDMTARVLDLRWPEDANSKRVLDVCSSLKEFITMLSLYGGDMNERLWDPTLTPSDMKLARWSSLTHLQLHGPRFRMTAMTALALCGLPELTHLCLIMPWIIQAIPESITPAILAQHAHQVERATDATGQETVMQLLYRGLGRQLQHLVLVCHNAEGYVGSVAKLGPLFRALHWWEEGTWNEQRVSSSPTILTLVTAELQTASESFHPSMLTRWMMQRAQKQLHWTFPAGIKEEEDGVTFSLQVESWKAPTAYEPQGATTPSMSEGAVESQRGEHYRGNVRLRGWSGVVDDLD